MVGGRSLMVVMAMSLGGRMRVIVVTMSLRDGMGGMVVMRGRVMAVIVVTVSVSLNGCMVVMTVGRGRVVVVRMAMVVVGVILDCVRRSRMVVVPMGVRDGMRGVVVMPVRVRRGGGLIVMPRRAVVVVRLVLVAHLGSVPQPLFRGLCGEIGIT